MNTGFHPSFNWIYDKILESKLQLPVINIIFAENEQDFTSGGSALF